MIDHNDPALGATITATRLDAHEKICAERYGEIKESFARVHARLDKIIYGLIGLLLTMVGWLVINGVPWKH
jgi:predicted nucleic acid-binding Zn ribbon protein